MAPRDSNGDVEKLGPSGPRASPATKLISVPDLVQNPGPGHARPTRAVIKLVQRFISGVRVQAHWGGNGDRRGPPTSDGDHLSIPAPLS